VNASDKSAVDAAVADLKKALQGSDIELIKQKTEALKQSFYKVSEQIYKNSGAQGKGGPQGAGPQGGAQGGPNFGGGAGFAGGPNFGGGAGGTAGDSGSTGKSGTADDVDYRVVDDDDKNSKK